jgi:hypothetical protein
MPFLFSESGAVGDHITLVTSDQVPVTFRFDAASGAAYTPADPLAWTVPPPDDSSEALDELATTARAGWAVSATLAGASPRTFDTAVTPVKSGRYQVTVNGGGLLTGAGAPVQVVCQIRVDAVLVPNTRVEAFANDNTNWALSTTAQIVVPRTAPFNLGGLIAWQFGSISNGYVRLTWWEI